MNIRKNSESDSRHSPTTILHHVNLTFDMQTSNIGVNHEHEMTDDETKRMSETRRDPSGLRDDGHCKLQNNSHGQNHNDCIGYNVNPLQDKSNGNSHGVVNVTSVQHMPSSGLCWD